MVQAFLKKWWVESDFKAPNMKDIIVLLYWTKLGIFGYAKTTRILLLLLFLMKFKTQKSVTDKITSNNLNSMGFNSFLLRSTFGLLFIHGYIEINNTSGYIWRESWISHHKIYKLWHHHVPVCISNTSHKQSLCWSSFRY